MPSVPPPLPSSSGNVAPGILPVLADRRSSRAIDPDRPVPPETVGRLLEAARWAPSWGNMQPWRFVILDDRVPEARAEGRACLTRGNAWAHAAPLLVLAAAWRYKPDSTELHPAPAYDVGAACLALCLQAQVEGLVAHQMGGFAHDRARRALDLPDAVDPLTMIAVGHPGEVARLDARSRGKEERPRTRREVAAVAHLGCWDSGA